MTKNRSNRCGVSAVEGALVLSVAIMLLAVIFDLGLASFRQNTLAAAARRLAREAIVHGSASQPEQQPWGPAPYAGNAADQSPYALAAAPLMAAMSTQNVAIEVSWPDGDNGENDRVEVQLSYPHRPLIPFLSLGNVLNLRANSVMRIAH